MNRCESACRKCTKLIAGPWLNVSHRGAPGKHRRLTGRNSLSERTGVITGLRLDPLREIEKVGFGVRRQSNSDCGT